METHANRGIMGEAEKLFQQPSAPSNELDWSSPVPAQIIPATLVCRVCRISKPIAEMSKDKNCRYGHAAICNPCMRNAQNTRRANNLEQYRKKERANRTQWAKYEYDDHTRARKKILRALKTGQIVKPSHCSRCAKLTDSHSLHAHHTDYSKPLEVEWICSVCHGIEHRMEPTGDAHGEGRK